MSKVVHGQLVTTDLVCSNMLATSNYKYELRLVSTNNYLRLTALALRSGAS